ncbi:MAG: T9SS type A sorting domain-containing protein [Saprospiraceae bacterium]|nr:T9SS type A sorting domain-containing protein [Saprospiraceae bacterium]
MTVNATDFIINVLSNDVTANGVKRLDKIVLSNHGTARISADKSSVVFTPDKDFKGVALVNYTLTDNAGHYDCGLATIHVFESNLPDYQTVKLFTRPGEKIIFTVPKNTASPSQNPQGAASWVGDPGSGVYYYTPRLDASGESRFGFLVEQNGLMKSYDVVVDVVDRPVPVFLKDDYVYMPINSTKDINVYQNDSLAKPIIDIQVQNASTRDCGVMNLQNGHLQIIPNNGFKGVFNFDYEVTYADGTKETATVHTTIANYEPVADAFEIVAFHGTPYEFKYNIPLESSISNRTWSFVSRQGGITNEGGRYTISAKGEISYTPPTSGDFDSFEVDYCVLGSNCKTVTINVRLQPVGALICSTDCVFPGDANRDGIVDMWDLLTVGNAIGQYGPNRADRDGSWIPTYAENWQQTLQNGINAKNADLNGDGVISHLDTLMISANYGKINSVVAEKTPETTKIRLHVLTTTNSAAQGDMIEITVLVGTEDLPAVDARGLSFSVGYDADLIEENTISVDFLQSNWLSRYDAYLAMSKLVNRGRIEAGIARSQNRGVSGHGEVSKIRGVVIDDVAGFQTGDKPMVRFRINDVYLMDNQGRRLMIEGKDIAIPIKIAKKDEPMKETDLLMFPNPSSDFMSFYLNGINNIESLRIVDMMGKEVSRQNNIKGKQATVYFDNFTPGMYIAEVMTEKGKITKKMQVVK